MEYYNEKIKKHKYIVSHTSMGKRRKQTKTKEDDAIILTVIIINLRIKFI